MKAKRNIPIEFPEGHFSTEKVKEITQYLREYATVHRFDLQRLEVDQEDFIQDIFCNMVGRQGYNHYDPTKVKNGSFQLFIYRFAKNYLIDLKRAKYGSKFRSKFSKVSIDSVNPKNGLTLSHVIAAESDYTSTIVEMLDLVPEQQISETFNLSWRDFFRLSIYETVEKIAETVGMSVVVVKQTQKELYRRYLTS